MAHYWDAAQDGTPSAGMQDWINWGKPATPRGVADGDEDFPEALRLYFWPQYDNDHRLLWTDDMGSGLDLANLSEYGGRGQDGLWLTPDQLRLRIESRWPSKAGTIPVKDRYDFLEWTFTGTW